MDNKMNTEYIQEIQSLLSIRLSDDPQLMVEQVKNIEAHGARLIVLLGEAEVALSRAASKKLLPKTKDLSEFEREISLRSAIASEQKEVNVIQGLIKALNQRVNLCQSFIRQHGIELQSLHR